MRVSVIIPTYNVASYLADALDSVLDQHYPILEIIIVDNNSTDTTLDIAYQYQDKCPDIITILRETKQGAPYARNLGLKHASGDWIQFLDADDIILPDKIKHQCNIASNHDIAFIAGGFKYLYLSDHEKEILPTSDNPFIALFRSNLGTTSANLWKKNALLEINGFDTSLNSGQEYDLMFRLLCKDKKVYIDKCSNTIIRQRATGQISGNNWSKVAQNAFTLKNIWKKHIQSESTNLYSDHQDEIELSLYYSLLGVSTTNLSLAQSLLLEHNLRKIDYSKLSEYNLTHTMGLLIKWLGKRRFLGLYHFGHRIIKRLKND